VYYWRIGREYGKNDLPGNVWPSTFYLYFIIPFWWFINLEQINLIGVDNAVESFVYSHPFICTMYLIGSIFFAMIVASYLALFSSKPRNIAFSIFGMNALFSQPKKGISRLEVWKKWTIITLITLLIAFPIRLRVLSCGGYIDDSKLVFTSHLGIQTQVYNFDDIVVEKPELVKQGNRYGVKVKASAPTLHIIKVDVETSFEPIIGVKEQSESLISYLSEGMDVDSKDIFDKQMFGRNMGDVIKDGINAKLTTLPDNTRVKLQNLMKTLANKGKTNLIAIVF
jgi:stage IV sporulation protein A